MQSEDRTLLMFTHLSQLLEFVTVIGGFVVPLILWVVKRNEIYKMDEHGRAILNFQISLFIYTIVCIPLILVLGLGIVGLVLLGIASFVLPIVNAIRANNGRDPYYPLSIPIL
ncbi:DUF4870 domain-containing protein [Sungkyunkwania multivorans]|uniref:DUF4870 domain-containing protein n=1 Tax=Sungkyunkwania multivorans TaxID=1173618 RepID=A0ABW3CWR6_9FLAO